MARAIVLALVSAVSFGAQALPEDRQKPMNVTADEAEFNELAGRAIYVGSVVLTQGNLVVTADRLEARLVNGEVTDIDAQGSPATFEDLPELNQPKIEGQGQQIQWSLDSGTLEFEGDARLVQTPNRFAGEEILYFQTTGVIEASNQGTDSRVEMTLTPATNE